MKRSDMVDVIGMFIRNNTSVRPTKFAMELGEKLLTDIEKVGMLPPNKEGDIVTFKADSGLSGINAMIKSHRWEPEDETQWNDRLNG